MANPLYHALLGQHETLDAPVLILPDGETVDYATLAARVARLAGALHGLGLTKGDRVAVQVAKSPEALALYLACLKTGIVFVPLNTAYTAGEIGYFVGDAEPGLVVCDPADEAVLTPIAAGAGAALLTLDAQESGTLPERADAAPPLWEPVTCDAGDLACFLYTSGTTGRSKGAMLTQANLLSNARTLVDAWRFTRRDVLLHALPIFHAHGLFVACNVTMMVGGAMIWQPGFDAQAVIRALPRATAMMGVPTYYTRLLDSPGFTRESAGHMRLFTSGSAPLLSETHDAFRARTGHAILERYGMTETGMNSSNPHDGERRAGTVGFALDGVDIRVTDPETGREMPQGETGMIEVRGPNVFKGYWRMPEKTAEELRADGFFITGDLGRFDADGYLTIVGRQKDLIISGGYNVYPKEIELILDAVAGIRESAVFGVAHPDFGEAVVAAVVPGDGAPPEQGAILADLAGHLANYKRPKRLFVVDALPRNTMGKVQKNILRETYALEFSPGDGDQHAAAEPAGSEPLRQ